MVDKRQIRREIKQIQRVKTWQLVVLLILACFLSATFLRLNNIGMIERRSAVISADGVGNDKIIRDRLYDLQRYVSAHMNTSLGKGIYLDSSYRRDVQAAYAEISNDSDIYQKAQEVCAPQFTSWSPAYVECTRNELAKYPAGQNLELPDAKMYLHNFISPLWSSDFAGWSILICVVIFIMIVTRFTSVVILRMMLHHHNKGI